MQAKKRYLLLFLAACVSALLVLGYRHLVLSTHGRRERYESGSLRSYADGGGDVEDLSVSRRRLREALRSGVGGTESTAAPDARRCRMHSCFDFSRCRGRDFKVYVYPSESDAPPVSPVYQRILRVIRQSGYATADASEACVFVPAVDTVDRDPLSPDYARSARLTDSPLWNGGQNHLVFNLFSGTWPDYSEELGLDIGLAMLAKSSIPESAFRPGFDIALPLFPKAHPERGGKPAIQSAGPVDKGYLLVFKGKRYVYGIGSDTRNALHHLNNGRDVLLLTTCRHGKQWMERRDERCEADNRLYDRYDYGSLMENATFCLVPRGRRLGSFRFLESLQAGCVPVLLANGWELPFGEALRWEGAALRADERLLLQVPDTLRSMPRRRVHAMRQRSQLLWETYFSSVDKIVLTVLQILRERVRSWESHHGVVWNSHPGALLTLRQFSDTLRPLPFHRHRSTGVVAGEQQQQRPSGGRYTAVVYSAMPSTQPLQRLLKSLLHSTCLDKVLVVWGGESPAPVVAKLLQGAGFSPATSRVPVHVVVPPQRSISARFAPHPLITTDAVLALDEDVMLTAEEMDFGFRVWQSFPERIVGYPARSHYWDDAKSAWGYSSKWTNEYSMVLTGAAFYHRYYHEMYMSWLPESLRQTVDAAHNCEDILMNFLVSQVTRLPPIKVTQRKQYRDTGQGYPSAWNDPDHFVQRQACINAFATYWGHMPLVRSSLRLDPVLFRDPVSNLRKRYRRIDRVVGAGRS
ncbi:exostosin glycosyltransferase 1 ttv isoform X1 [Rhipicephalus microplus]|uniref:exostosin glycosyltransferase 1 ttv isoform X1 n=1 Tax=Rhipicephalus microplus TaxID=6941 RepID=UPI003F6B0DD6